jgi:hypothetical protein
MAKSESFAQSFGLAFWSPRGEVMTMTLVCGLDEALLRGLCVGYPACVSLSGFVMVFRPVFH